MIKIIDQSFKCYSMSLTIFVNEFDLYRNAYRFLMNVYVTSISMNVKKKNQRANVFFITLKFYDSEFSHIVDALFSSLIAFDRKIFIIIKNFKILLCVFTFTFTKDLSQQFDNKRLLKTNVNYECNQCYIHKMQRNDLIFDVKIRN